MPDSVRVSDLLKGLSAKYSGSVDARVSGLFYDSRQVVAGGAFFALRGGQTDGHLFVDQALQRGAIVVVTEESVDLPEGVTGIVVSDTRAALAQAAATFYGNPTADMPTIGITGTNGKTTVSFLLECILQKANLHPAVFGTINYRLNQIRRTAPHTTPEAVELMDAMADFKNQGADSLIMEVSSHALQQRRADGVHFNVGVFTNLTPEHLDFHGDMESYFASKKRLMHDLLRRDRGRAVINVDDAYGQRLAAETATAITCGRGDHASVHPLTADLSLNGIRATVQTPGGAVKVNSQLLGEFNLQNLLCAIGAAVALDLPLEAIAQGIEHTEQIPGRMERIANNRGAVILVDYAHTGDALEKVLATVQGLQPRRVLTVFGCGGDRDPGKRAVMANVANRYSDVVIVTSDNPRSEDPQVIIDAIVSGLLKAGGEKVGSLEALKQGSRGFWVEDDRRRAIDLAVSLLKPSDLMVLAGKGHEDYQIIGDQRFHFDDREELRRSLTEQEVSL